MIIRMTFSSLADRKLSRRFLFAAIIGVLFFSLSYSVRIARADVEISDGTMQALYHFNASTTQDAASHGWNLDGGAVPVTLDPSFVASGMGKAYDNSSSQTYAYTSKTGNFSITGALSMFAWMQTRDDSGITLIGSRDNDSWYLQTGGANFRCGLTNNGGGWTNFDSSSTVIDGTPHLVGCTWDGSHIYMWRDGVVDSYGSFSASGLYNSASKIYVGSNADGHSLRGYIDEAFFTDSFLGTRLRHEI